MQFNDDQLEALSQKFGLSNKNSTSKYVPDIEMPKDSSGASLPTTGPETSALYNAGSTIGNTLSNVGSKVGSFFSSDTPNSLLGAVAANVPEPIKKGAADFGKGLIGEPAKDTIEPGQLQTASNDAVNPNSLAIPQQAAPQRTGGTPGMGALNAAANLQSQGIKETGEAKQAGLDEQSKIMAQQIAERNRLQQEQMDTYKAQQARVDDVNNQMNKAYDDYSKKNVSIDNYWADKSTGAKVLSGLAIILGGIGQLKGAKTNTGLDIINAAIDRDLNIQKTNLEQGGRNLEFKKGLLADNLKRFGDIDQATMATKMMTLQSYQDKLQQAGINAQSAEQKGNIDQAIGQIKGQQAITSLKMQALLAKQGQSGQAIDSLLKDADTNFDELKKEYGGGGIISRALKTTPVINHERNTKIDILNSKNQAIATSIMGRAGANTMKEFEIGYRDSPELMEKKRTGFIKAMNENYQYKKSKPSTNTAEDLMDEGA